MSFVELPIVDDDIENPIVIPNPLPIPCFPRTRPTRLWTLEDYERLTRILSERFGVKNLTCAAFSGLNIDPAEQVRRMREVIEQTTGEEDPETSLRAILAVLIVIYGYLKKIKSTRLYRWVLRRFIIFTLLIEALDQILESIEEIIEAIIVNLELIEEVLAIIDCGNNNLEE